MKIKEGFIIAFILFFPLNNILADALDKKAELRYQAMEQEMSKLMADRDKVIDEAMTKLTQEKPKERFFFIQKPGLSLLALRQNPLMPR